MQLQKVTVKQQSNAQVRRKILAVEHALEKVSGARKGDDAYPLKHTFTDGLYIREIFVPAGQLIVTKIHKFKHPYFLMEGDCSVLTEGGAVRIKAPYMGITPAGTKRVVYTHSYTWWITVHATDETDLEKIEDQVIAKNFDEVDAIDVKEFVKEVSHQPAVEAGTGEVNP